MEYVSHDEQGRSCYGSGDAYGTQSVAPSESMPCSSRTETVANDLSVDYRLALEGLGRGGGLGEAVSSPSLLQPRMTPRQAPPADTTRSVASYASSSRTVFYESPRPAAASGGGGLGVPAGGTSVQYRLSLEHIELDTGSLALGSTAGSSIALSARTVFLESPLPQRQQHQPQQQQRQEQGQEEQHRQQGEEAGGTGTGPAIGFQLALEDLALDESLARSSARRSGAGRSALSTARSVSTAISSSHSQQMCSNLRGQPVRLHLGSSSSSSSSSNLRQLLCHGSRVITIVQHWKTWHARRWTRAWPAVLDESCNWVLS